MLHGARYFDEESAVIGCAKHAQSTPTQESANVSRV